MFILAAPEVNWFWNTVYGFLSTLDAMIYNLVSVVTEGFFNLSFIELFTSKTVDQLTSRIYVALAVFMIFKLAFSLIQYLVSPDQVNDKQAGMGKLVSRTATAFILLIAVPIVFDEFLFGPENAASENKYQAVLSRAISRIILGSSAETQAESQSQGSRMGNTMAAITFAAFVQPNTEECEAAEDVSSLTINAIAESATKTCSDISPGSDKTAYAYQYQILVSTIVGLVMLVIMLFFTVDMAIRTIKLGVLRVMAPIPIISYVDPKSAKDGAFNNWLKAVISTYLELFIKLIVIYLVIFIIIQLTKTGDDVLIDWGGREPGLARTYAKVFIIIGLLLFAVQASQFIKNIFGIKGGGSVGLSALMGGAGALLAGGGLAGAATAMKDGAVAGAQGKGDGQFSKGKELGTKVSGRPTRAERMAEKNRARFAEKAGVGADAIAAAEDRAEALQAEATEAEIQAKADPTNIDKQRRAAQLATAAQKANDTVSKMKEYAKDPRKAAAQGKIYTRSQYAAHTVGSTIGGGVKGFFDLDNKTSGADVLNRRSSTMGAKMNSAEAMAANANKTYRDSENATAKAYQEYLDREADIINDMNADEVYNHVHSQPAPAPGPQDFGDEEDAALEEMRQAQINMNQNDNGNGN